MPGREGCRFPPWSRTHRKVPGTDRSAVLPSRTPLPASPASSGLREPAGAARGPQPRRRQLPATSWRTQHRKEGPSTPALSSNQHYYWKRSKSRRQSVPKSTSGAKDTREVREKKREGEASGSQDRAASSAARMPSTDWEEKVQSLCVANQAFNACFQKDAALICFAYTAKWRNVYNI